MRQSKRFRGGRYAAKACIDELQVTSFPAHSRFRLDVIANIRFSPNDAMPDRFLEWSHPGKVCQLNAFKYLNKHPLQVLAALLFVWAFIGTTPLFDHLVEGEHGTELGRKYLALRNAVENAGPNAPEATCAALRTKLDEAGRERLFAYGRVKFSLSRGEGSNCQPELTICTLAKSWPEERTTVRHALNALKNADGAQLKGVVDSETAVRFSLPLGKACPAICNGLPLAGTTDCQ